MKKINFSRRWPVLTGCALLLSPVIASVPQDAHAVVPPFNFCRFNGVNPTLHASPNKNLMDADFYSSTIGAMNAWNRSAIKLNIINAADKTNIKIVQASSTDSAWAYTNTNICTTAHKRWPTAPTITLNDATMTSLPNRSKQMVVDHELGHAVGLDHVTTFSCSNASMMVQGTSKFDCSTLPPWADDATAVNSIYSTAS